MSGMHRMKEKNCIFALRSNNKQFPIYLQSFLIFLAFAIG